MLWIRIGFSADLDPDPALQVNLDPDPRIKWSKIAIYYLLASIENVQATGEAASPQREHSAHQTNIFFFCFLWIIFAHLDPDPDPADQISCNSMRIRIHNNEIRMDQALRIYPASEQGLCRLCHGQSPCSHRTFLYTTIILCKINYPYRRNFRKFTDNR